MQPLNIAHREVGSVRNHQQYIKQAGDAILSILALGAVYLKDLRVSQGGTQNGLSVMEVSPANLARESLCQLSLPDRYHRTWEQFPPNAPFWDSYLEFGNTNDLRLYFDTMYSYAEQLGTHMPIYGTRLR